MVAIAGTTVLITGAASGVGRRMAQQFAAARATVVIWDLDEEGAARTAKELSERTGRAHHAYRCDVGDEAAVADAAERVRAEVGEVDILINNAGVIAGRTLMDLTAEQIATTYRVNALALYWTTRALLPQMVRRNRGHVVTIASAGGMIGVSHQTDYAGTKHAAMGFDEALRPPIVRALYAGRILPTRAFDDITDFLGVTTSMADFRGRTTPDDVLEESA